MSRKTKDDRPSHTVRVSQRFLLLSWLLTTLVAFAIGRTARMMLIVNPHMDLLREYQLMNALQTSEAQVEGLVKLPSPILQEGKVMPQTSYTSKNFDTGRTVTSNSRWIVTDEGRKQCVHLSDEECVMGSPSNETFDFSSSDNSSSNMDEELHMPKGQHLLIDIENVDSAFLDSEERLANAMLELVYECGLTLLSYHCHKMTPMGVSCAGVLLESHVSFHTWPAEGVITLDLYTCGDSSLLPIVPLAESLFSIPSHQEGSKKPKMIWAHKYRGFNEDGNDDVAELTDMFHFPLGRMTEYKQEIASAQTDFQRVDIYDVLRPHFQSLDEYKKSLLVDGSYEATHPEFFEPDRLIFLDGVIQSRRTGDAAYHEALVHPALFAHENPKRVAIIGGGEGATLREILKHNTIEKVVMIEIDEKMVQVSREHIPFWSDCGNLQGSTASCFDDPRVEVYYEDAFAWFIDRYGGGDVAEGVEPFDIIVMDALDPQVQKDFVDALYDGGPFLRSLPNAIGEDGILVAQVGAAPKITSPSEEYSLDRNRVNFVRTLVDMGFESIRDYEESHGGFEEPWQIIVAFKSFHTAASWYPDSPILQQKIRRRITPTKDGMSPLLYFDGATMMSYSKPSKSSETVFCRRSETSEGCQHGRVVPSTKLLGLNSATCSLVGEIQDATHGRLPALNRLPVEASDVLGIKNSCHSFFERPLAVGEPYNPARERWTSAENLAVDKGNRSNDEL